MTRKKDDNSLGCLLIIVALIALSWIFSNLIGVIGIILIIVAIYLRLYKRQISPQIFWLCFSIGVIITAVWFTDFS